ncbi:MAG: restriction endonuclease [Candidatus Woesearchaeota archaeon]
MEMKTSFEKGLMFEKKIQELYKNLGYIDVQHNIKEKRIFLSDSWQIDIKYVDPIIKKIIYVEFKYKENDKPVTRKEIAQFIYVLESELGINSSQGEFVTNSSYDRGARRIAKKNKLRLVDGNDLYILEKKINEIKSKKNNFYTIETIATIGFFNYIKIKAEDFLKEIL